MPDLSLYKVGVVLSTEECGSSKGKTLRACKVNVGDESNPLTVVTLASNVREGSRLAVAPVGSTFLNDEGEEITVTKTSVGGVMSEGIFCDSKMLGWSGGAAGVAAQIPDSVDIGVAPPSSKPRPKQETTELPAAQTEGLFEKKLSKEEKKKLAEEKRKARKQAKEAKKEAGE